MGGLGTHQPHPYDVQTAAFLISLLLPLLSLLLVGGALREHLRRKRSAHPARVCEVVAVALASE